MIQKKFIKLYNIPPYKKWLLFFYRCLLNEDKATMKCLAFKLTQHLVDHIKVSFQSSGILKYEFTVLKEVIAFTVIFLFIYLFILVAANTVFV